MPGSQRGQAPAATKQRAAVDRLLELNADLLERACQLEEALGSRIVIEQATGVLVARHRVDLLTAFEALRRGARSQRVRLRDLAERVVQEPETPPEVARYFEDRAS
jgi:AmiR/NasT family two-component response regulator